MRHIGLSFACLAFAGLIAWPAVPAAAQDATHRCKKVRRAIVWSASPKDRYVVVSDEFDRQFVVDRNEVQPKSRSRRSQTELRAGDIVIVCCNAFR